jgi:hypothetical protein
MSLMTLNPCINLSFDGRCEAAFKFYERCLNGKISFMPTPALLVSISPVSKSLYSCLLTGEFLAEKAKK